MKDTFTDTQNLVTLFSRTEDKMAKKELNIIDKITENARKNVKPKMSVLSVRIDDDLKNEFLEDLLKENLKSKDLISEFIKTYLANKKK